MKRLFFITLACLFSGSVSAQIEMNSDGAVGIGIAPSSGIQLSVSTNLDSPFWGMSVSANATSGSGGFITGMLIGATGGTGLTYGIDANIGGSGGDAVGFRTHTSGGDGNAGVSATATGGTAAEGGSFTASGATTTNTGVNASGSGTGGASRSYGILAVAGGGKFNYGIHATGSGGIANYAGYFNGNVTVTGTFSNPSDLRFKEDVLGLRDEGVLDRVLQLRPVGYQYRTSEYESMGLPEGNQYGLIAQEVEMLFPELVSVEVQPAMRDDDTGEMVGETIEYKALNYIQIIPLLIQVVQEQQAEIEELRAAIEQLTQRSQ